ncbi:MOSC domain-containing protein [Microbulbifer sp. GL-2]|uniref:MOSC domain-containing protein n=1 Tax=Microbulbifer sp. GL-2 TaxID=2591606 RepID=UPI001164FFC8|nr:MOSC domain-containing protein [Microbulbifer sp. GL-2]BBM03618.1 molybdenum cofactor biosysynthesis protein [Microbulbifer sp. GL-2]
MKIVSVNVSRKKVVEYKGEPVSTGIFKKPVKGKVFVGKGNLEGDEQADLKHHGGIDMAVYAFASDHYNYWQQTLYKSHLPYGTFGENLTVSGLIEDKVFIGDQFLIGDCLLEVSQPRIPCFKLNMALDNDNTVKLFKDYFNTGVYFRVLEEGYIGQEKKLSKVAEVPGSVSVNSMFRALFDKEYAFSKQVLEAAHQLRPLSQEWREKVERRLKRIG